MKAAEAVAEEPVKAKAVPKAKVEQIVMAKVEPKIKKEKLAKVKEEAPKRARGVFGFLVCVWEADLLLTQLMTSQLP